MLASPRFLPGKAPCYPLHQSTHDSNCGTPGRAGVFPIEVVIAGRHEERRAEIEDGPGRRGHTWPASLPQRCHCCAYIALQVAHASPYTIAIDAVDRLATGPLVEHVGEINSGTHCNLNAQIEARI